MTRLEGNGYSRLAQMFGPSKRQPTTITMAVIKTLSPISVRIDGDSMDMPAEGIIVAEDLLDHKRTIDYTGGTVSGNVSPSGTLTTLNITGGELTIKSPLKVGDSVIVAVENDGQLIYILAKAAL